MAFWRSLAQPARYAALLAGALPVLAFPAPNLEFLAWAGLVPGLLLLRAAPSGRDAAVRGWWFGAGYLLAALYWLTPNLGPGLLLVVIVLGAPWTGVGYAAWRLLRGSAKADDGPKGQASSRPAPSRAPAPVVPTAVGPAGVLPSAGAPHGAAPTAPEPATQEPATQEPGTQEPCTQEPCTQEPAAKEPTGPLPGTRQFTAAGRLAPAVGPDVWQAAAALLVLPSSWVLIDWIRSWQGIGGPWAVFGASQWQHPVVLALSAVGGIWLVSFVLVLSNTGIAIALTAASWLGRALGVAAAIAAIAAGPAAYSLTTAEYAVRPTGHITLALVQPGLEPGPQARLAAESSLSRRVRGADLIVWGESSVGYDLYADHAVLERLVRLSAGLGTQLLVSQDALSPTGAKSKVAVLIGPDGISGTYVKTRLVPFGEYIPFRSLLGWLASISRAAPQNMIAGNGAHVLHGVLAHGRRLTFGVLICFESSFPDMSAVDTRQGAQLLIYQTSDSTFQGSWALEQHASLAAIRAAETGRPAVQTALTGDSAAFDSRGRQLGWKGSSQRGVLRVTIALPATSARTPFDRLGDYVPWFAIGVVAISILCAINAIGLVRRLLRGWQPDAREPDQPGRPRGHTGARPG